MVESLTELCSKLAGLMFILGTIQQYFPYTLQQRIEKLWSTLLNFFNPYVQIRIDEYSETTRNEVYAHIKSYLGTKSNKDAKYLKAEMYKNSKSVAVSLDEGEEVIDEFDGVKLKWHAYKETFPDNSPGNNRSQRPIEKKSYTLTFEKKHQDIVTGKYLKHVIEEGKAIEFKNRKRKIYSNDNDEYCYWYGKGMWRHINFEHPANFDTLAMDPEKKEEIINDLIAFTKGKDYYSKVGKAWKRGYLLHGPPGTGKSTMIAAIANFLNYDIYDLELTSVKDNSMLKKLLMETTSKSIIVIEDIDCSINLTGERKKKKNKETTDDDDDKGEDSESSAGKESEGNKESSKLTLSGLLNFIDGIWSACGQERIIIFTTNHVDKLDPALIRRGRMDMHIEMSYCRYEAFKVLAKNYLGIETHHSFEEIQGLLEEVDVSPCDVAENLMPKNALGKPEICLDNLIQVLKKAKGKSTSNSQKNSKSSNKIVKTWGRLKKLIK